jgi:hypothetical protein
MVNGVGVLGSGAGGTVRLIKTSQKIGGQVHAVNEFRPKHTGESGEGVSKDDNSQVLHWQYAETS